MPRSKNGALVTIDNLEKMAMPVIVEYETKSGKKGRINLPVEIWQNAISVKARIPVEEELISVTIDPDKVYPDYTPENNSWTPTKQ